MTAISNTTPILVVEDNALTRQLLVAMIEGLGYRYVDSVGDGERAWRMLQKRTYGLVICDWSIEPLKGYDLLRRMRADERFSTIPFVMATVHQSKDKVQAAREAGANHYLVKPIQPQRLEAALASLNAPPQEKMTFLD